LGSNTTTSPSSSSVGAGSFATAAATSAKSAVRSIRLRVIRRTREPSFSAMMRMPSYFSS